MTLSVQMTHALQGFSLDVQFEAPPGVTVLFGRSGSGKTTLINGVAGLLTPQSGHVSVGDWELLNTGSGRVLPPHRRKLGYIFQDSRLFPHMNVRRNLTYARWFSGRRGESDALPKVVEMLGIGHLLERYPNHLSGGEKQRVAIGRALMAEPHLLLADEPLAALDEPRKAEILPYFERLRDELEIPILYVTHSVAEVARLATTVVVLDEGRVLRQGPPEDVLGDPSVMPTGVRGAGALISARVVDHHADGLTELDAGGTPLFLPKLDRAPGAQVRLRIAAHDVILSRSRPEGLSALNILEGQIASIRSGDGPGMLISLSTPAGQVLARVTRRSAGLLDLKDGIPCFAIIKSVAIAPGDIGAA